MRTPFQRDRDRIVHSKSFRRLKHKTQVFVAPEGDHYRTRLTHTLEACFISRTVARALGLNEDLTEAIGLGHDLGHPPFGHIGEEVLDEALQEHGMRFRHNEHSLRVVDELESDGRGLNLTEQVRDGILNHTGPQKPATLEGRVVRIVDRVAYINHDIDDALRAGIIEEADLPADQIELLGETGAQRIDLLVQDMVERSRAEGDIAQSEEVGGAMLRLRKFMFDRVYLGEEARAEQERAQAGAADAVRPLPGEHRRGAGDRSGCGSGAARDRLHRRNDRPFLPEHVRPAGRSAIDWVDGEVHGREQGPGQGGRGHPRDRLGVHRPAADGARTSGATARSTTSGRPSFKVNPRDKLYYCFGCEASGDVFRFVEEKEGLTFPEAVESLAERYGVEVERENEDPQAEERRRRKARLWELLERTAKFYERYLWESQKAGKARDYLGAEGAERGRAAAVRGGDGAERLGSGADREPAGGVQGR